jgi:hypothetical protein
MVLLLCSHLHISAATLLMSDCLEETVDWNAVMASFPPPTSEQNGPFFWAGKAASGGAHCGKTIAPELIIRLGYKRAESLYQESPNTLVEGAWSANRILSHRLALCASCLLAMAWQRSGNFR